MLYDNAFELLYRIKDFLRTRGSGLLGGIPHLLIIADAIKHRAHLFSHDEKMNSLAKKLGAKLVKA